MRKLIAGLLFGVLLGAAVAAAVDYYVDYRPLSRAMNFLQADVVAAQRQRDDARAQLAVVHDQQRGLTIIEEVDSTPSASTQSNGAEVAIGILGALAGRNLSGLAAALSAQQQSQQPAGWHGFAIRGRVELRSVGYGTQQQPQAYYTFCATDKSCTDPAPIFGATPEYLLGGEPASVGGIK